MAEDEAPGNTEPQGPPAPDQDATHADLGETQAGPGATPLDATQVAGAAPLDHTREQPPVDGAPPPPQVWSARAQVRPPGDEELAEDEWEETAQPGRGLLVPVVLALAVLALATLLGVAAWLALRNRGTAPLPTPTPTATTPSAPRTTTRTTSVPPTTVEPTSEGPAAVAVPDVRGHTYDDAVAQLTGAGLKVARHDATSTTVPAGQVIDTNPGPGELVTPGFTVTVTVSVGPPTPPPPPPTTASPTGAAT
jgi:hypothetical protein